MYHGHAQSHCIGFFDERSARACQSYDASLLARKEIAAEDAAGHRGPAPLLGTWLGIYGDHGRRDPPYGAIAFADEA